MGSVAFSQSILQGRVSDNDSNEPIPFANVLVLQGDKAVAGAATDVDGYYTIKPINAGKYSVKVMYVGYQTKMIFGVNVNDKDTMVLDIKMSPAATTLSNVEIVAYQKPRRIGKMRAKKRSASPVYVGGVADVDAGNFNTESYDFIRENSFQSTQSEPLSTFSIDVDRASYSNMRRFLNQSQMPPKDAVRIEEMINYFDYSYPQPKGEDPFSINLESGNCPWNPDHQIVHIGLQGKDLITEEIPPNNLVFLLDVSGSMSYANKLPLLKKSFKILLDQLRPEDRVAIVVYAGAAGLVLPSTNDREEIEAALNKLQAGGSTAGGQGIQLAYKVAMENFIKDGNNRVILATDGDFNVGVSDNGSLVRMIEEKRESGVFLSILGFGMGNYKDAKMEQLSNAGNGNYAYIDNILEANKVFGKEIWGTLYTIAKDVKIQIEFNPKYVQAYRLIGYENRMLENKDFNDDTKDAGEIGAGHSVTAVYEIIPVGVKSKWLQTDSLKYQKTEIINNSNEICTVKFRYKEPDGDTSKLIIKTLEANTSEDEITNSENYEWSLAVIEFGMLLRDSEYKGKASYSRVLSQAKEAKGEDINGYRAEFIQLVKKAKLLHD
jgi:Ca-activated chloride channel family protein